MAVKLNFGDQKFWLRPPGSDPGAGLVHLVYRSPGTAQASIVPPPKVVPAYRTWKGAWKIYSPDKSTPVAVHNKYVLGWAPRHVPIELAFLEWSFARFDKTNGNIPSKGAPDGYWDGLMIYSWMENDWKLWTKFGFAPSDLEEKPIPTGIML